MKLLRNLTTLASAALIVVSYSSVGLAQAFTDIKGNPYETEIEKAAAEKIVSGFPNKTFRPTQKVTREQAVSIIIDALSTLTTIDVKEQPTRSVRPFLDVEPTRWSYDKITWFQWNIIPQGTSTGNFRPGEDITRAELLDFLRRSAELLQVKMGGSSFLSPTQAEVKFSDVSGYNAQLTQQMSAYCGVASPLNEKGNNFAPTRQAQRDYTTAAVLRTIDCAQKHANKN